MAEKKITGLPSGGAISLADLFEGVQSGGSVKLTASQILAFIEANANMIETAILTVGTGGDVLQTIVLDGYNDWSLRALDSANNGDLILRDNANAKNVLRLESGSLDNTIRAFTSGNVGIGYSTDQSYKLAVNGTIGNTTGTVGVISDERLKKDIKPVTKGLEKSLALADCAIHYNLKDGIGSGEEGYRTGWSADKLKASGLFDGHIYEREPTDAERKYVKDKVLNVDNSFIQNAFVAIKEQQEQIEELKARLNKLEGK